jgi:hypothetical protein
VTALLWAVAPAVVLGQNVNGKITGNVSDSSGAAIGQATVTLTNLDTNVKHQIATDASGSYSFPNITPGRYKIQVEKSGFKNFVREPIVVEIESGLKIDIALPVGAATETIEVTGEAPLLQPETNSLGQVIEQRTVTDLPLNGRNPIALTQLVPGVVPQGQPSAGNSSTGNPVGANPFALGDFQIGGGMAGQAAGSPSPSRGGNSKLALPVSSRTRKAGKGRPVLEMNFCSRSVLPAPRSLAICARSMGCCRMILPDLYLQGLTVAWIFSQT